MLELDAVLFEQVAVQSSRQRREICAARHDHRASAAGAIAEAVALQIADEGEGIPQADLEHIFDKFYRAQKTDQVRAGTGLGLAISRGFVEAMHGTIVAGKPHRPQRRRVHDHAADPGERQRLDAAA